MGMMRGSPDGWCNRGRALVLAGLSLWILTGCDVRPPLRIGFSGCLSGRLSDLGLSGRNGAFLAVEARNVAGGIDGRPVELLVKDDRHDPAEAKKVDRELIDAGVLAIVGHMTSSITREVLPLINQHRIVLLSPTTSAAEFNAIDDFLIRVIETSSAESTHLAANASGKAGLRSMAAIVDLSNPVYSQPYLESFSRAFASGGGRMYPELTFLTDRAPLFSDLARQLVARQPGGVLLVTAALDAAMLCQQIRKLNQNLPIYVAGWAHTPEFLEHGGRAVEGVLFSHIIDPTSQQPRYLKFRQDYLQHFSREPDFAATLSFEATELLLKTIARAADRSSLKPALLGQGAVAGLQGDFTLDRFGDVQRPRFLITVAGNRYQRFNP